MRSTHSAGRHGLGRADVFVGGFVLCVSLTLLLSACQQKIRTPAARTQTINCLKMMVLATHAYNDVHKRLPPAFDKTTDMPAPASLHVHLLPYLENDAVYKMIQKLGDKAPAAIIPPFLSPVDPTMGDGTGVQNYAGNLRVFADRGVAAAYDKVLPKPGAVDPGNASIPRTFADGCSNTMLYATRYSICGAGGSRYTASPRSPYGAYFGDEPATRSAHAYLPGVTFQLAPTVSNCIDTPFTAQSFSQRLCVGLGDASARSIGPKMSPETWNRAMQPNDGYALLDDWNP